MWEVRFSSQLRYRISGWLHGPVQRHRGSRDTRSGAKRGAWTHKIRTFRRSFIHVASITSISGSLTMPIIGPPVRATTGFALERDGFIKTLTLSLLRIRVLQPH